MASKQTYECFVCRKNGFTERVYLDGKDENGRTKYLNEDMGQHYHKQKQQTKATSDQNYAQKSSFGEAGSVENHAHQTSLKQQQEQLVANITTLHKELMDKMQSIENKMDHMCKLIYAITGEQQKDYNLLDNR